MHLLRAIALGCMLAAPLSAADAPTPAQLAAEQGVSPYAMMAEYELPLPPTEAEVQSLPEEQRRAQAYAMKRVLLLQALQSTVDGYTTPGNYMACAALAHKLQAPESFVQLMQAGVALQELPARASRALDLGLQKFCELYGVDLVAILFYARSELASAETLAELTESLPLESLFDLVDTGSVTVEFARAALPELRRVYEELTALYAGITSEAQAEAAVPALRELMVRYFAVAPKLMLAPQAVQQECSTLYAQTIPQVEPALREQRVRLREAGYYDCATLRVMDSFFE